jgi:hypothetical protein
VLQRRVNVCAVAERNVLVPVESVAVRIVSLEDGLIVHGVLMMGEGPLPAAEVVEEEDVLEVFEEVDVAVNCDCAVTGADDVSGLKQMF